MHPLAEQIERFLQDESAGIFDELSLTLFEYQFAHNEPYRRLCKELNVSPDTIASWRDIPAVPAAAFKRFDLSCRPLEECPTVFHSSGTTERETSRHWMDADALHLYETSLREGYKNAIGGPDEIWALMPTPSAAPHSSLSHMLGALGAKRWFWDEASRPNSPAWPSPPAPLPQGGEGGLKMRHSASFSSPQANRTVHDFSFHERDPLRSALISFGRQERSPIALFGTAFYFVGFFDSNADTIMLPEGSIVIETGGYKGRTREVPRAELYGQFTARFGVPPERCYGEYGMCEMASQFYSQGPSGAFRGPHWVHSRAIDPVTGEDADAGTPGLLRHYDLANFNSVMAIQTQDMGVIQPDGSFTLLGRAPQAEVRGCSLTVEELWSART